MLVLSDSVKRASVTECARVGRGRGRSVTSACVTASCASSLRTTLSPNGAIAVQTMMLTHCNARDNHVTVTVLGTRSYIDVQPARPRVMAALAQQPVPCESRCGGGGGPTRARQGRYAAKRSSLLSFPKEVPLESWIAAQSRRESSGAVNKPKAGTTCVSTIATLDGGAACSTKSVHSYSAFRSTRYCSRTD